MTTLADLIYDALLPLGTVAAGESLDPGLANDCMRWTNRMLSSWSVDGLMVFTQNRQEFPLVIGQQVYTLGPGGTLNNDQTPRPIWFTQASVIPTASAPALEIPIDIYTDEQWQDIPIKPPASQGGVSTNFPLLIHPRGDWPLNTIDVWPTPTAACKLVLYLPQQLTQFSVIQDVASFPPGYEEAIVAAMTFRFSGMLGVPCPPTIAAVGAGAKALLKGLNVTPQVLSCDSAMCGYRPGPSEMAIRSKGYVCD